MSCFGIGEDNDLPLSITEYQACKNGPITRLQEACRKFTKPNINCLDEELADSWVVLFQLHFTNLEENDLKTASDNFESVFQGKRTKVLFLNHLIPYCENNISLLERACVLMSEDILPLVSRKIIVLWVAILERNWDHLCHKTLGNAVRNIHEVHKLKPLELKLIIELKGKNCQEHKFPLLLLLTYEVFQGILYKKPSFLTFEKTSILVLQRFEVYLWKKKFPECDMSPPLWGQLLHIAFEIEDKRLIDTCLKKITPCPDLEYNFIKYSVSGKLLLEQKRYQEAAIHFEKASQSPFFKEELSYCQALMGYLKEWEKAARGFSENLLLLNKKKDLGEPVDLGCLKPLQEFLNKHLETIQSLDLLEEIKIANTSCLGHLKRHLDEEINRVSAELLLQAEKWLNRNFENTEEHYFLSAEVSYAKGDIEEMGRTLALLELNLEQVSEEMRFWNLQAKLHIARGEIAPAKQVLEKAIAMDSEHEETLATLMQLLEEGGELIPVMTDNRSLCLHYAVWLYKNENFELAKFYFLEKCDPYHARVNFYLGKLTDEPEYFKKALELAKIAPIELPEAENGKKAAGEWHLKKMLLEVDSMENSSDKENTLKDLMDLYPYESEVNDLYQTVRLEVALKPLEDDNFITIYNKELEEALFEQVPFNI